MSPFGERFLFVTGKGGVGKTTIAASLARMRSRAGERVLLAVTDPAAYRQVLPGARFEPDPIAHEARFYTVHVEAESALKEYGRLLIKPRLARQALFDNRFVQGFLTALPGLPQWAVLGKAWYHTTETIDGVPGVNTRPCWMSFSRMSLASALLVSALSFCVMSAGSLAGPHRPYQL